MIVRNPAAVGRERQQNAAETSPVHPSIGTDTIHCFHHRVSSACSWNLASGHMKPGDGRGYGDYMRNEHRSFAKTDSSYTDITIDRCWPEVSSFVLACFLPSEGASKGSRAAGTYTCTHDL
jgi:hypothetical protein